MFKWKVVEGGEMMGVSYSSRLQGRGAYTLQEMSCAFTGRAPKELPPLEWNLQQKKYNLLRELGGVHART